MVEFGVSVNLTYTLCVSLRLPGGPEQQLQPPGHSEPPLQGSVGHQHGHLHWRAAAGCESAYVCLPLTLAVQCAVYLSLLTRLLLLSPALQGKTAGATVSVFSSPLSQPAVSSAVVRRTR